MDKPSTENNQKPSLNLESQVFEQNEFFRFQTLNEVHAFVMVVAFLASAFYIVCAFNRTVITVLEATRLFATLGLLGFGLAYMLRKRFELSLLDGLFYSLFGFAPILLAFMLFTNSFCSEEYTETHKIISAERGGSGFTYELENGAYEDYWHIRNLDRYEANNRHNRLQFTVCNGTFGYKVIINREITN